MSLSVTVALYGGMKLSNTLVAAVVRSPFVIYASLRQNGIPESVRARVSCQRRPRHGARLFLAHGNEGGKRFVVLLWNRTLLPQARARKSFLDEKEHSEFDDGMVK